MALRIGIDVGGTFTHGVVLRPPGEVLERARVPTTHTDARGVAAGVEQVLALLLDKLPAHGHSEADVELVAHSTTQATNALLEGDLSGVHLMALVPPGERALVSRALNQRRLDIGGGHSIRLWPKLMHAWDTATAEQFPAELDADAAKFAETPIESVEAMSASPVAAGATPTKESDPLCTLPEPKSDRPGWEGYGIPSGFRVSSRLPVAVVQPLAGKHELRERTVAAHYRACGHSAVCASDITQVLGLKARSRTAAVNAAMLPTMLATANYTEQAVRSRLPHASLQVVRSDGGAMSIDEMRRQPILSLLSGPAAGASAALHRSGLSDAVFIEVGGTSTDITLIRDGRVRHRSATVGGQRLMVPALDLRTVAVGGGSMLRADKPLFGPRSAHKANLPYLFVALQQGLRVTGAEIWTEPDDSVRYIACRLSDGSMAAYTLTDFNMAARRSAESVYAEFGVRLGTAEYAALSQAAETVGALCSYRSESSITRMRGRLLRLRAWDRGQVAYHLATRDEVDVNREFAAVARAFFETCKLVNDSIDELARSSNTDLSSSSLVAGGGGAPVIYTTVGVAAHAFRAADGGSQPSRLIADHQVISAIGAALAVTCVSLSRNVAQPGSADIAELTAEVEARLAAQGAERVSTDYEYDPRRQVLTVTGRGSRPYDQDARPLNEAEQQQRAAETLSANAAELWQGGGIQLWQASSSGSTSSARSAHQLGRKRGWLNKPSAWLACATDRFGRVLWQGRLSAYIPALPGQAGVVLDGIVARFTQHTDGGAVLPGLALLADGRLIPLDSLGSAELIAEVLRWENLPPDQGCCFIVRGYS